MQGRISEPEEEQGLASKCVCVLVTEVLYKQPLISIAPQIAHYNERDEAQMHMQTCSDLAMMTPRSRPQ